MRKMVAAVKMGSNIYKLNVATDEKSLFFELKNKLASKIAEVGRISEESAGIKRIKEMKDFQSLSNFLSTSNIQLVYITNDGLII